MNLKDYREKELKAFVIANILIILCLNGMLSFEGALAEDNYMKLIVTIVNSGLFSSIIYALVMVCDCLISSEIKQIIIFWWRPMPGETIFSDIKKDTKDLRFSVADVQEKYADIYQNLPKDVKERRKYENGKWYGLYRQHESEKKIEIAQRDFLMCRDMAVSSVLTAVIYLILALLLRLVVFDMICLIYLAVIYFVCMSAARTKSKRFVKTVIACDIHSQKEKN